MDLLYILYIVVSILFVPMLIWGVWAQYNVNSTFSSFSKVPCIMNYTADAAVKAILDKCNIKGIDIVKTKGSLTDNYDPKRKVISLSQPVFGSTSISAIGVAAHECGHAIQHSKNYLPLKIRTALVPIVNFFSRMFLPLLIVGIIFSLLSFLYLFLYSFSSRFAIASKFVNLLKSK